jgi:N-acetylglucosaminyl-diphospho-decaprenol L-rhamnosyltransferase
MGSAANDRALSAETSVRPTVSAITVTYFTGPVLWACLRSLLAQPELLELIIVINGADPNVRAALAQLAKIDARVSLVDPGRNLGFARGCNLGAETAQGCHLAFVNPDCVLAPRTLRGILDVFQDQPSAWLVGGRLQHPDGREQRGGRREFLTPWRGFVEMVRLHRLLPKPPYYTRLHLLEEKQLLEPTRIPVVSGAFMIIRRACFERLGGMDDNFFLHVDDSDLCLRIHLRGGEVWYAGNVPITHYRSTSRVSPLFVEWHKTLGCCYYFQKHFRGSYPAWSLHFLSAVLWARLLLITPKLLLARSRHVNAAEIIPDDVIDPAAELSRRKRLGFCRLTPPRDIPGL